MVRAGEQGGGGGEQVAPPPPPPPKKSPTGTGMGGVIGPGGEHLPAPPGLPVSLSKTVKPSEGGPAPPVGTGSGGSGGAASSSGMATDWAQVLADLKGYTKYFRLQPPWEKNFGPFPSVYNASNWVRAKFQLMMGSLSGWNYNANIASGAYFNVALQSADNDIPMIPQTDFPVQLRIDVVPASSSDSGRASGTVSIASDTLTSVSCAGALNRTMNYLATVTYSLTGSDQTYQQTSGPYTGQEISNQANPMGLIVPVQDFPSYVRAEIILKNPDGTPGVGYLVQMDAEIQEADATPLGNVGSGLSDEAGTVRFDYGQDLNRSATYLVGVLASKGASYYARIDYTTDGGSLMDGTLSRIIELSSEPITLTVPKSALTLHHARPPPHHQRAP